MRIKVFFLIKVLAVFSVIALAGSNAQAACSNSSFQGVFAALVKGSFIIPPSGIPAGPTARVGLVTPDGAGNTQINAVLSLDGITEPESYPGTYTINPDCTAVVVLQVQFPGIGAVPFTFNGMLAGGGTSMELILVSPQGADVRISLRKETAPTCSAASLSGLYVLQLSGTVVDQFEVPTGVFGRVGKVQFDGNIYFTASVQTDYNGVIVPETITGTYAVSSNCTFTMSYYLVIPSQLSGVLSNVLNGAYLIQSEPNGSVITGSLTSVTASGSSLSPNAIIHR
jgi:hypothetical protein